MIHLFNAKTSKSDLIENNGDYILNMITSKAIITEGLNDEYSLDATFKVVDGHLNDAYDMIAEDSLIKINDEYGEEYFRIAQVKKDKKSITVFARHLTISDILTMWCESVRPENQNGNGAINWIFDGAKGTNPFKVSSNISDLATAYYENKTVYEALFTADNSFLKRWGGEVYRRGFNIQINNRIGADRGVSIRSRKNLTGFESNTNLNSLTTRIYPKGYNGITIDEKFIDSPIIGNYARVYSREVKFDDVRVNDDDYTDGFETLEAAQEELRKRVNKMYEVDKVDVISATYRVDFVQLEKTEEYKNYSILERTWLGDTVNVIEENLNVDIDVRVIKRQYDCLKKERISTELSNKDTKVKPPTLGDIVTELEKIPNGDMILEQAKENATALINAGMKDSHVVVRKNEILIMDTEDINTCVEIWRFNRGGLGFSNSGYYGKFETAITNDGQIVADFITAGILNANLIKTGILTNYDNNFMINMETGEIKFVGGNESNGVKFDNEGISVVRNNVRTMLLNDGRMNLFNSSNGENMGYFGTVNNDLRVQLLATNTFSVFAGQDNLKVLSIDVDRGQSYGNAMMDICGGIVFTQKPNQDVGFNAILLGNDDRSDSYGLHNLSIRCHNSLGFQDNYGYTHMFFNCRNGNIITKGRLYESCETPPSTYLMDFGNDGEYASDVKEYEVFKDVINTNVGVVLNSDNEYNPTLLFDTKNTLTNLIDDSLHTNENTLIAALFLTVKKLNEKVEKLENMLK